MTRAMAQKEQNLRVYLFFSAIMHACKLCINIMSTDDTTTKHNFLFKVKLKRTETLFFINFNLIISKKRKKRGKQLLQIKRILDDDALV